MWLQFDRWTLDIERAELRGGGESHSLRPKLLGLLCYLVKQRDRLVSKEELIEQVWDHQILATLALSNG